MDLFELLSVIGISIFLYYLYDYFYGSGVYWKKRGVPTMNGALPFIGHMWKLISIRENFIFIYNKFYNEKPQGSMLGVYNFRQPILIVRDPEIIKTILLNSFINFDENASKLNPELDPLLDNNPFYSYGNKWKSQRVIFHSALTKKNLKLIAPIINDVTKKFSNFLNSEISKNNWITVEAQQLLSRFTAEVVAAAAFNIDGKAFTDDPQNFHKIAKKMFEPSKLNEAIGSVAVFFPILRRIFRVRFMPYLVDQYFRKILKSVQEAKKKDNVPVTAFLKQIIDVYETKIEQDDENFIAGHCAAFFLDGYITSSVTLAFTCYHIAAHHDVQEKLRLETMSILEKSGGMITFDALQEMKYMEQVINETMRLFPVLGYFGKICTKECKLIGSDGLECAVEPGTEIIIPAIGLHRDPKFWDNPDKFDPDRFDQTVKKDQYKYIFLPFGTGPRMCLGMRVAMMQMKAALATLVNGYSLRVDPRTKEPTVDPMSGLFTIPENKLWIRIEPLIDH